MSRWLPPALLVFALAAFALPTEAAFSLAFYVCVVPLAVLTAAAGAWRRLKTASVPGAPPNDAVSHTGLVLALALVLWSGLTLIWGEGDPLRTLRFLVSTVATACFVWAAWQVLVLPGIHRRLATWVIGAGAANAAFVLLFNAPALLRGDRILGWGVTRQPILGGSVMAVACLTAIARLSPDWPQDNVSRGSRKMVSRTALVAAIVVMAGFILAMQSRGVLVGFTGGTLLLGWMIWRWRILLTIPAFYLALAPPEVRDRADQMLLARGTSHRPEIWAAAWHQILRRPIFGHGLAANLPIGPTGFPHDLYLSLLFYSGAAGLLLFAALGVVVTLRLVWAPLGPVRAWGMGLWANALLAGLTDFGQITKGPGPLWFILWLPVVLALSLPARLRAAAVALPREAS
jgi:O-antigen ligase